MELFVIDLGSLFLLDIALLTGCAEEIDDLDYPNGMMRVVRVQGTLVFLLPTVFG